MVWPAPAGRAPAPEAAVVNTATPDLTLTGPELNPLGPVNVTVPSFTGAVLPPDAGTVAVKVTGWPKTAAPLGAALNAVLVPARLTVRPKGVELAVPQMGSVPGT